MNRVRACERWCLAGQFIESRYEMHLRIGTMNSPEDCGKLAGDTIPGKGPLKLCAPARARETA